MDVDVGDVVVVGGVVAVAGVGIASVAGDRTSGFVESWAFSRQGYHNPNLLHRIDVVGRRRRMTFAFDLEPDRVDLEMSLCSEEQCQHGRFGAENRCLSRACSLWRIPLYLL